MSGPSAGAPQPDPRDDAPELATVLAKYGCDDLGQLDRMLGTMLRIVSDLNRRAAPQGTTGEPRGDPNSTEFDGNTTPLEALERIARLPNGWRIQHEGQWLRAREYAATIAAQNRAALGG